MKNKWPHCVVIACEILTLDDNRILQANMINNNIDRVIVNDILLPWVQ